MEPVTLAAVTVGVLAPYLGKIAEGGLARLGETAADSASQRVADLYRALRARITGSSYEESVLEGAEAQPENERRLAALRAALTDLIEADPDFAERLATLVDQAKAAGARHIQVAASGAVAGNDFHQSGQHVAGRDLHIGDVQSHPGDRHP